MGIELVKYFAGILVIVVVGAFILGGVFFFVMTYLYSHISIALGWH